MSDRVHRAAVLRNQRIDNINAEVLGALDSLATAYRDTHDHVVGDAVEVVANFLDSAHPPTRILWAQLADRIEENRIHGPADHAATHVG